jgi:hypothetical protein
MKGPVMALDLATVTGWAIGNPGELPAHGSIRFGGTSSHEATFAKAMNWMAEKCKIYRPSLVVWEAPLAGFKGGKTTNNVTTILYGLPAVIGAVAYNHAIYNIRKADTRDVRNHFIGCSPKRDKAKLLVIRQCRAMGWEVQDDNEADALATWSYMCSLLEPKLAIAPLPLFGTRGRHA